jgi:uncharacterized membrane protein
MTRKLKLAFLTSVLLNVVLIGIFLGQSPHQFDGDTRRELRMEKALEGLPPESQSRLRDKFRRLRSEAEPLFKEMRRARDEALTVLGTAPLDESALARHEARIFDLRMQMSKRMSQAIKVAISDLTPEERRRFAEMLRRPGPPERGK